MKAPPVTEGDWTVHILPDMSTMNDGQLDPWGHQVGNGEWAIADVFKRNGGANAKMLAASKEVARCLNNAILVMEAFKGASTVVQQIIDRSKEALLEAGYTEE